ncbi:hypothetical protein K438DRAFT_1960153 [Mycena galopus ATCC 62051]|nr:hypothetical protein K438DRAFT_1960153 [Mycena galopus ATCC 62051]
MKFSVSLLAPYGSHLLTRSQSCDPESHQDGAPSYPKQHTDDAATKLSDSLCHKCGFLERTHSCAPPEQFLRTHSPLASSTLRSCTSQQQQQ